MSPVHDVEAEPRESRFAGLPDHDAHASGGILVSPLGFQDGAKKVAAAEGIHEVFMDANSTRTDYMLRFLNTVFVGASDTIKMTDSATVTKIRAVEHENRSRQPTDGSP